MANEPKITICEPGYAWGYSQLEQEVSSISLKSAIRQEDMSRKAPDYKKNAKKRWMGSRIKKL